MRRLWTASGKNTDLGRGTDFSRAVEIKKYDPHTSLPKACAHPDEVEGGERLRKSILLVLSVASSEKSTASSF